MRGGHAVQLASAVCILTQSHALYVLTPLDRGQKRRPLHALGPALLHSGSGGGSGIGAAVSRIDGPRVHQGTSPRSAHCRTPDSLTAAFDYKQRGRCPRVLLVTGAALRWQGGSEADPEADPLGESLHVDPREETLKAKFCVIRTSCLKSPHIWSALPRASCPEILPRSRRLRWVEDQVEADGPEWNPIPQVEYVLNSDVKRQFSV